VGRYLPFLEHLSLIDPMLGEDWNRPRLCKNQEILIRMVSSGNHRLPRSRLADCFQYLTTGPLKFVY
jgi:hypothetical protein